MCPVIDRVILAQDTPQFILALYRDNLLGCTLFLAGFIQNLVQQDFLIIGQRTDQESYICSSEAARSSLNQIREIWIGKNHHFADAAWE